MFILDVGLVLRSPELPPGACGHAFSIVNFDKAILALVQFVPQ